MYVYLAVYAFWATLAFQVRNPRQSWHLAVLAGFFLFLFIGGRNEVGCDFNAYVARYETLYPRTVGWLDAFQMEESGFHLVNIIARDLGLGFAGVVMICGAVYSFALVRFSRLAPRPLMFVAIAFPILVVQLGMSGMRQAMATAFLMLAYLAFARRRSLPTAAWIFVAYMFHESAIAFLPLAMLARRQVSTKYIIGALVVLAPLAGWLLGDRLSVYSDRYVEQIYGENSSNGAWLRYGIALLPFLLFLWKRKLVERAYPKLYPVLWLFSLATVAVALVGAVSSVALHRLTFYLLPVSLLALLCVTESAFSASSRRLALVLPLLMYAAYIGVWFMLSRHGTSCYIPYQNWLLP